MMDGFTQGLEVLKNEITILTDWYTDELFDLPYPKVITPFSRIFCDVERFPDDETEVMAQFGMGMCYTHTDDNKVMREITPDLRFVLKTMYYQKHHDEFERLTSEALLKYDKVLIIDCHSFPEIPMKRDLNQYVPRPDFCIGTDDFHTHDYITSSAVNFLQNLGYTVKINNPYAGSIVPMTFYLKNENVMSLMVEINRKLYMRVEKNDVIKTENFLKIKELVGTLIKSIENVSNKEVL
ncbi:N-formylglutamate amidohydrolase [Candidatus Dojkabacteria bacterium]|nr:N-formylglutamate amidohydrolase [Candidatus Dojkabacteria bacterium]